MRLALLQLHCAGLLGHQVSRVSQSPQAQQTLPAPQPPKDMSPEVQPQQAKSMSPEVQPQKAPRAPLAMAGDAAAAGSADKIQGDHKLGVATPPPTKKGKTVELNATGMATRKAVSKKMTAMLERASKDQVTKLVGLECRTHPDWALELLRRGAPHLQHLEVLHAGPQHWAAIGGMTALRRLSLDTDCPYLLLDDEDDDTIAHDPAEAEFPLPELLDWLEVKLGRRRLGPAFWRRLGELRHVRTLILRNDDTVKMPESFVARSPVRVLRVVDGSMDGEPHPALLRLARPWGDSLEELAAEVGTHSKHARAVGRLAKDLAKAVAAGELPALHRVSLQRDRFAYEPHMHSTPGCRAQLAAFRAAAPNLTVACSQCSPGGTALGNRWFEFPPGGILMHKNDVIM